MKSQVIFRVLAVTLLAAALLIGCADRELARAVDTRVLLVGIDGADWKVIDELLEAGDLPHLGRLRERGVWAELETLPDIALSPAIWTSIATGQQAADHGIAWFLVDDGDGGRSPVRSHNRRSTAIWNILANSGLRASVVGWWATYPAEQVGDGVMISDALGYHGFGRITRDSDPERAVHPPELAAWASARMPALHQIGFDLARRFMHLQAEQWQRLSFRPARDPGPDPSNPIHLFQMYAATAGGYAAITEDLLSERNDHLTMVYFEQVDSLSHLFMKCAPPRLEWIPESDFARYRDVVDEWYRYQDELLGRLLERVDLETTAVIVVSDHGFKSGERRIRSEQMVDLQTACLDHERYGILVAAGPHIRRGVKLEATSVLDVTPTLLHYLGLPVARDMEGRVLEAAFTPEIIADLPVRWVETYETGQAGPGQAPAEDGSDDKLEADMLRGLEALGYLGPSPAATAPSSSPEIHNALARSHLGKGEVAEARREIERSLAIDPSCADTILVLASVAEQEGRSAEVERLIRRAIQLDPDSPMALAELASLMRQQGHLDASIRLYNDALRLNDSAPFLYLGLGDSLQRADRLDEAERAFRRVLELEPDSFEAHYNLGVVDQRRGQIEEAEKAYQRALATAPEHPAAALALNNLANLSLRRGDQERALDLFKRAAETSPDQFEARFNLGTILLTAGRPAAAIPPLEQAAQLEPGHSPTVLRLGLAYIDAGRPDEARGSLRLLHRLEPGAWSVLILRAALAAIDGHRDQASALLGEARARGGKAAEATANLSHALVSFEATGPAKPKVKARSNGK